MFVLFVPFGNRHIIPSATPRTPMSPAAIAQTPAVHIHCSAERHPHCLLPYPVTSRLSYAHTYTISLNIQSYQCHHRSVCHNVFDTISDYFALMWVQCSNVYTRPAHTAHMQILYLPMHFDVTLSWMDMIMRWPGLQTERGGRLQRHCWPPLQTICGGTRNIMHGLGGGA